MKEKILFVDDSKFMRKIVNQTFAKIDVEIIDACDGKEALKILETFYKDISLILTDWNMPNMNGFELLQVVKSNNNYKHIPVILATTEAEKENINKALKAGAENYIIKPFNTNLLIKTVLTSLKRDI